MNDLLTPGILLKIIGVAFVLITLTVKSKESTTIIITAILLMVLSSVIHVSKWGIQGLIFPAAGAILACITVLPLYTSNKVSFSDFLITLAAGGIMGISGYIPIIFISCFLITLQWILHPKKPTNSGNSLYSTSINNAPQPSEEKEKIADQRESWALSRILFSKRSTEGLQPGQINGGKIPELMPWRIKISLSTLVVLMVGFSI